MEGNQLLELLNTLSGLPDDKIKSTLVESIFECGMKIEDVNLEKLRPLIAQLAREILLESFEDNR